MTAPSDKGGPKGPPRPPAPSPTAPGAPPGTKGTMVAARPPVAPPPGPPAGPPKATPVRPMSPVSPPRATPTAPKAATPSASGPPAPTAPPARAVAGTMVRGSKPVVPTVTPVEAEGATMSAQDPASLQHAPDDLLELKAGSMVGEYRIDGRLGEGGMATVYSATHPLIGKRAAIKVMSPQLSADTAAVERFVQEAQAVNRIGHPNIIDVFGFGTLPDGRSFFVMELLPGETLHARMESDPLKLRDSIAILFDVCDALEAAHEKGIVHRDLKPENVFLVNLRGNKKQVKLLDFGVAKLNNSTDQRMQRTRQDTIIGTPHYLSPEQARAKGVDARTDIYSLGVMAFEMVTGKVPFDADNVMDVLVKHMNEPPPVASLLRAGIPPQLDDILVRMLAKDPAQRPTIDEIRASLSDVRDVLSSDKDGFMGPMEDSARRGIASISRSAPAGFAEANPNVDPTAQVNVNELERPPRSRTPVVLIVAALLGVGVLGLAFSSSFRAPQPTTQLIPTAAPPAPVPPSPAPVAAAPPQPAAKTTLRITIDAPDATIEVDENVIAERASSATVTLGFAGTHIVKASAPGRKTVTKVITVMEGEMAELALTMPKAAASKPKPVAKKNTDYMMDPFGKH
jgi:eukaryotic-like serine/threonine-protein kinase